MQCQVLVQKTYIVGHYVTVYAKNSDAREEVNQALLGDGRLDLYERIKNDYEEIESEIDEWFKDGDFVLNAPSVSGAPNAAGITMANDQEWGRPLVIEEAASLLVEKGEVSHVGL